MIKLLKARYPVFGEFVDAISSSFAEAVFDALRKSVVRRIIAKRAAQPDIALASTLTAEAKSDAGTISINWRPFDERWRRETLALIEGYRAEISRAEAPMEALAAQRQSAQMQKLTQSESATRDTTEKAGKAIDSKKLLGEAADIKNLTAELLALGADWPALKEPSASETAALKQISSRFDVSNSPDITVRLLKQEWFTPQQGIANLQSFCQAELVRTVAESSSESEKLKAAMGKEYDFYLNEGRREVKVAQQQQLEEAQKLQAQQKLNWRKR